MGKVWSSEDGHLMHILNSHPHCINSIALSSDYVLRTGIFEFTERACEHISMEKPPVAKRVEALKRYEEVTQGQPERLASGSDDFTLSLWLVSIYQNHAVRMTGHQNFVIHVCFSPDGKWLASASFDNSVRLWCGISGQFLSMFHTHIAP